LTVFELQGSVEPKNNCCTYTDFTRRLRNLYLYYHLEAINACVCRCVSTNMQRTIPTFYVTLVIKSLATLKKILPVFLCGCEAWSFILIEADSLRAFANRVLRKTFGSERDEVRGVENTTSEGASCSILLKNVILVIK